MSVLTHTPQAAVQSSEPSAAEMAHAAVFTADGYVDDDGEEHITQKPDAGMVSRIKAIADEIARLRVEEERLAKIHDGADARYFEARPAKPDLPLPADLSVEVGPRGIVRIDMVKTLRDGEVVKNEILCGSTYELRTEREIRERYSDDPEGLKAKLKVWRKWRRDVEGPAMRKAQRDRSEAHDVWYAAYSEISDMIDSILDLPITSAADLHAKVQAFKSLKGTDWDDDERARYAALAALERGNAQLAAAEAVAVVRTDLLAPWLSAKAEHAEAALAAKSAEAALDRAYDAREVEAPVPEALALGPGRWYLSEQNITRDIHSPMSGDPKLTVEEAAEKLAALRAFRPIYDATTKRLRIDDLERENDDRAGALALAAEALLNTPAPDAGAALEKLMILMSQWHGIGEEGDDAPAALTGSDPWPWGVVRVAQDLMRLTGSASPMLAAEPFDAEGFIQKFTAIPGHLIDESGRVSFMSPDAWPGRIAEHEFNALFTLNGERLATYRAAERQQPDYGTQPGWTEEDEARVNAYTSVIVSADTVHWAYPDDPAKVAELRDIAARQAEIRKSPPAGAHLWKALTDWQKEAVRETAKRLARRAGE